MDEHHDERTASDVLATRSVANPERPSIDGPHGSPGTSIRLAPLTFQQETWWQAMRRNKRTSTMTAAYALRLSGPLDLEALPSALSELMLRHSALRTRIVMDNGSPRQLIHAPNESLPRIIHCKGSTQSAIEEGARDVIENFFRKPLDLSVGPNFDVVLLRLSEYSHVLVVGWDHIFTDSTSAMLLFKEMWILYGARKAGRPASLPTTIQYADYALWQRASHAEWVRSHTDYWQRKLAGAQAAVWPRDSDLRDVRPFTPGELKFLFGKTLSTAMLRLAREERTTPATLLLALYAAAACTVSGQRDFLINFYVNGRRPEDIGAIGLFSHDLLLRIEVSGTETFRDLLRLVSTEFLSAWAHLDYGMIYRDAPRSLKPTRLMWYPWRTTELAGVPARLDPDTIQACPRIEQFPFRSKQLAEYAVPTYDWVGYLNFANGPEGISGHWVYRADLHTEASMQSFAQLLQTTGARMVQNPTARAISR